LYESSSLEVHTNKESHKKQPERKPGLNCAERGLGRLAQAGRPSPFRVRFGTPFDLAAIQTIYSPPVKSHEENSFAIRAEELRREGHHPGEERVEMVD
jgi:hypothetical protein